MRKHPSPVAIAGSIEPVVIRLPALVRSRGPSRRLRPGSQVPIDLPPGSLPVDDASEARTTHESTERCQGRVPETRRDRAHPCARRPTLRVTGTERLTADLCAQHGRMAVDRPGLVRHWLQQERIEGARRVSPLVRAGDVTGPVPRTAEPRRARSGGDLVLRVAAELASLAVVRAALSHALRREGWAERLHPLVLLAVGEALANAIEHGSPAGGAVEVGLTVTPEWATIRVADSGRLGAAVPLGAPISPCSRSPRGRGRLLMVRLAEEVEVRSDGHGTSVLLRFARPAAPAAGGEAVN